MKWYEQAYGLRYTNLRYFNAAGADPDGKIGEDHTPETHLIPLVIAAAQGRKSTFEIFGTDYDTAGLRYRRRHAGKEMSGNLVHLEPAEARGTARPINVALKKPARPAYIADPAGSLELWLFDLTDKLIWVADQRGMVGGAIATPIRGRRLDGHIVHRLPDSGQH